LTRCTFAGNTAGYTAGAFYNYKGDDILLYRCTFRDNSASNAGALSNFLGSMTIRNCIFTGNTAEDFSGGQGGAMRHWGNGPSDHFILLNSTIVGNSATGIGGPGLCGGLYVQDEKARIDNCIFWNNSDAEGQTKSAQILDMGGQSVLFNCCVQGWTGGGTANIAQNPLLIDPDGPDNVFGTQDDNLRLLAGSPCIDAGNNFAVSEPFTEDMDGNPRIQNEIVDIGAYEGSSPAIMVEPQSITVPEGRIVSFNVRLSTDPDGPIEVSLTHSGDIDIELETGPSLHFDSSNYDQPQSVELIGAADTDSINGTAFVYLAAPGYFPAGVTATEQDSQSSNILYVDDDAPPPGIGLSWETAFKSLQDALSAAAQYPQFNEIRVAQGTYKPDQGAGITPGSRDATFQLINNVTLKGGYAGRAGADPDTRDIALYRTILSGDLDGNDIEVADPCDLLTEPTRNENSRHVVTATNCGRTAVIDGFTITGGNADGPAEINKYGGGIYDGKPTISNCTVIANSADTNGGGISFYGDSHTQGALLVGSTVAANAAPSGGGVRGCAEIINCTINNNAATEYSAGGIYFGSSCETTVTDTVISNNSAAQHGGGAYVGASGSEVVFIRCTFAGNSATENAGALYVDGCTCGSDVLLDRCQLIANSADADGGAVYGTGYSLVQLRSSLLIGNSAGSNGGAIRANDDGENESYNCTFAHNTAGRFGGAISGYNAVVNSILWYNADSTGQTGASSQITGGRTGSPGIHYCCIQNLTSGGIGIIDDDPMFIDPDGPDDTPGNGDENFRLQEDSPCINRGDNTHVAPDSNDLDDNPRILGARVDMGAYEYPHPGQPHEQVRYDIIDLGTLGGEESIANAINNNGQIVGWARTYPHAMSACMFDFRNPANNIDLDPYGGTSSGAHSINIHGFSVGTARHTQIGPFHATLFNPSDPCDNIDLDGSESHVSSAESINDLGQIVGWEQLPTGEHRATLFDPTGAAENIDLTAGGLWNPQGLEDSSAFSINNEGQIVGYARIRTTSLVQRAVMFDQTGAGNNIILTPVEDDEGEALAINDAGKIVGWSKKMRGAAIFNQADPGNNLPLGAVPGAIDSKAYAVNNRGQIVGSVRFWQEARSYYSHAAIFDPTGNGDNRDLNNLIDRNTGWELIKAYGINDDGWIVGYGRYTEGQTRAFLLIPRESSRLVAHWKLDESEGDTAEDSAGDNDGTLRGDPLWLPGEGRVDGALLFDGSDDYVDCGNSPDFDITDQITVAAWVNIGAVNMNWQTVIAKGDSAWRLSTAEDEHRYHFAVTGGPPWNYINGETQVEPGEWHHVCGTYDGAFLRLYIDCIEDPAGPVTEANGVTTSDHAVYIGENQERPNRHWDGLIDDVRVYNYALTGEEISQLCKWDVLYVDKDARGLNNGCCWGDAFQCLQDALAAATDGTEIRVAEGTYKPDCGEGIMSGDREATFQLKNGVTIKGGYAGHGRPEPNAREISQYPTILSGDLFGNDGLNFANYDENSYHIVTGSATDATALIDGFTITHGGVVREDQCGDQNRGGGIYNLSGSPTVLNCTFIANASTDNCGGGGAAIYNKENSNPTVKNCTFTANAYMNADDDGGAAVRNYKSNPVFEDCTFIDNSSNGGGGAMLNRDSNPTLNRCIFMDNYANQEGGAIANDHSSPVLNNCTFIENSSRLEGGAVNNDHWCAPVFTGCFFTNNSATGIYAQGGAVCNNYWDEAKFSQCLFAGNSADFGGAIYSYHGSLEVINCTFAANVAGSGGAMYCRAEDTALSNSILWGNAAEQGKEIYSEFFDRRPGTLTISYTDVEQPDLSIHVETGDTLEWGPGNIAIDPCFADPENDDYHLKSFGWRWDPEWQEWTFDRVTSRCIDAGNPASPLLDEPLSVPEDPNNEYSENIRINMGAYGGTAEASLPPIGWSLLADINNDGMVNFCDFAHTGANWQATAPQLPGDLDRNKSATPPDLSLLAEDWLRQTTWRE
jgi:predicted outer membrane repeat protein